VVRDILVEPKRPGSAKLVYPHAWTHRFVIPPLHSDEISRFFPSRAAAIFFGTHLICLGGTMGNKSGAQGGFVWSDPFLLDDQLSSEERMIRDSAAAFAADKLAPRVQDDYLEERVDPTIFANFGAAGLLGATIPEEFGGLGASYVAYGLIAREIERVDSGYRSMMSVQSSLVMFPIHAYGSDAQRRKYLPKLASGEWIGCFGLTEPDAGSDPGSMAAIGFRAPRPGFPTPPSPMFSSSGPNRPLTAARCAASFSKRG
jgi:hypothetical protein